MGRGIGEFDLISKLVKVFSGVQGVFKNSRSSQVSSQQLVGEQIIGPGDDCAVIPSSLFFENKFPSLVITTDTLVERIHFKREYSSAFEIGWKSLAVNLSDIAAMGGVPIGFTIALELVDDLESEQVEKFYSGMRELAEQTGAVLLGGDTVSGKEFSISITAIGGVRGRPLLRSAAKVKDDLWVSGELGAGFLGLLFCREKELEKHFSPEVRNVALAKYHCPNPRLKLGCELAERGLAHAAIDISDGFFQDLRHLANASAVSVDIELNRLPLFCKEVQGVLTHAQMLTAGDDYELIFTATEANRRAIEELGKTLGVKLTRVGNVVAKKELASTIYILSGENRFESKSWLHDRGVRQEGYQHCC